MTAIAIDGPAGAGKSTIARALAKRLGYIYVDTGALYRAVAYSAVCYGMPPTDEAAVAVLLPAMNVRLGYVEGEQRVFVNNTDVTDHIRTPEMSRAASDVSAFPSVRAFLLELQRKIAAENNVVMDGRDIGTVVLPNAQIKIFLTASPEDRARRRTLELEQRGTPQPYEDVLKDVTQRDYNDSHRAAAPLCKAEDAILVDTTGNTLEQSMERLTSVVEQALAQQGETC